MLVTSLSILYHLSMLRPGNLKTSIVYCSAPSYMQHLTLDNSKAYTPSSAVHNMGLIWDLKIKTKKEIPTEKFHWTIGKP